MSLKRTVILSSLLFMILLLILFIAGIFRYGSLLTAVWPYSETVDWMTEQFGLDEWLARTYAIFLTAGFSILFPLCLRMWRGKKNRISAVMMSAGSLCVFFFFMHLVSRDMVFDPTTGEASKCYVKEIDGTIRYVACSWKYDRWTREKVKPMTPEIAATKRYQETKSISGVGLKALPGTHSVSSYHQQSNSTTQTTDNVRTLRESLGGPVVERKAAYGSWVKTPSPSESESQEETGKSLLNLKGVLDRYATHQEGGAQ
jgi:hypothetical protein